MELPRVPISNQISSVMDIFAHCMISLILENLDVDLNLSHPTLLIFEPKQNLTIGLNESYIFPKFIFQRTTFFRRKNPKRFCWVNVFPTIGRIFYRGNFLLSHLFPSIRGSIGPVYFVWIANQKQRIQDQLDKIYMRMLQTDLKHMGNREFCLFDNFQNIYHFNRYHRQDRAHNPNPVPLHLIHRFPRYTEFFCHKDNSTDCFYQIDEMSELVATTFNKYFWIFTPWMDVIWGDLEYNLSFRKMHTKHFFQNSQINWITLANESKSLDEFIAYTILANTLQNISIPQKIAFNEKYFYHGSASLRNSRGNHQIIRLATKSCSFISCYDIKQELSYQVFSKPFDIYTWIAICLVVIIFIVMSFLTTWMEKDDVQNFKSVKNNAGVEDIVIVSCFVLLETSFSQYISRAIPTKLIPAFWFWIVCCSAITSMYKDVFIADVIQPYHRNPSWSSIYDLEPLGFKFLLPVTRYRDLDLLYAKGIPITTLLAFEFSSQVAQSARYEGNLSRLLGYKKVAKALMVGDRTVGKISFTSQAPSRIWQELHYKWPWDLYTNLSKCQEKYVYLDNTENIMEILPFLNDNKDGIVFMKGADDKFLSTHMGFQVDYTHRKNFVYDQLKKLVTCGIYDWWKAWFKITKPTKLFPHYANWTKPVLNELERRDFMSKFTSLCNVWAICCVICTSVCFIEIRKKLLHEIAIWTYRISFQVKLRLFQEQDA
ncbi:hypothetical protein Fcan01_16852 [Folsomia candida]|uniref:Uncharacterized protein n=1 Tax=Folsomia candida TaxID=158441 RepID=A0A226DSQ9_FOLCA|nr:hypothetical protein Fcan01_16852 [Folsomia candida]